MNIKEIKSLAQILNQSGLTAIEVSEADLKIRLEKNVPIAPAVLTAPVQQAPTPVKTASEPVPENNDTVVDFNKINELKSPMVGVFYRSPSPESPPFVEVGSKVKKGDVLCIIEAMKLMNEITAECDGEIVDICAENGQLVEFSQILFKIF